jgi:hypothetical protein
MRIHITAAAALSMTLAGPAYAQCTTDQVTDVGSLLSGKLVCAQKIGTTDANNRWSEHHTGTSGVADNLTEWARGPGDAVDGTRITGTWTANGDTISYTYNGDGGPYSYTIYDNGSGNYSYCSGASEHSTFKLVSNPAGGNPCSW